MSDSDTNRGGPSSRAIVNHKNRGGRPSRRCMYKGGLLALTLLSMFAMLTGCARVPQSGGDDRLLEGLNGTFERLTVVPISEKQTVVGLYITNIYNLDISSNTYSLNGYLWMRWNGDFNPVETLEFTNLVEASSATKEPLYEQPKELPDGSKYQVLHIEGIFYQPFDLVNYPLDRQSLALYIEDSTDTIDKMIYLPDDNSSGYDVRLLIPGWTIRGLSTETYAHDYGTDLGESGVVMASKYSALKFSLEIARIQNMFLWKLLLPLMIVLLTNWLALALKADMVEVRTAMPATAMLTTVFLQQASQAAIPEVSTLVLMDKIYAISYVFIVLTLVQIIWANAQVEMESPMVQHLRKIDLSSFAAQLVIYLSLLAWMSLSVL